MTLYILTCSSFLSLEQARAWRWSGTGRRGAYFSSTGKACPESPLLYFQSVVPASPSAHLLHGGWGGEGGREPYGPVPCAQGPLSEPAHQSSPVLPHCPQCSSAPEGAAPELHQLQTSPEQRRTGFSWDPANREGEAIPSPFPDPGRSDGVGDPPVLETGQGQPMKWA